MRYPQAGVALRDAGRAGTGPQGRRRSSRRCSSGRATVAVWRYPRTEPLPRSAEDLRRARRTLLAAAQAARPDVPRVAARHDAARRRPPGARAARHRDGRGPGARRALDARLRATAPRSSSTRSRRPTTSRASTGEVFGPLLRSLQPVAAAGRAVSRRAFVVVLDACGAGALPDAADYGDAGANTLAHVAEAVGGLDLPALEAPRARLDPAHRRRRRRRAAPAVHGRLRAAGAGQGLDDRPLGAHGRRAARAAADLPRRLPAARSSTPWRPRRACASAATARPTASRRSTTSASTTCAPASSSSTRRPDSVLQLAAHDDVLTEDELRGPAPPRAR